MRGWRIKQTTWLSVALAAFLVGLALGRKWPLFNAAGLLPGLIMCGLGWRNRGWWWLVGGLVLGLAAGGWGGTVVRLQFLVYESLYGQQVTIETTAASDGIYAESRNLAFNGGQLRLVMPRDQALPGQMKFEIRGVTAVYRGDRLEVSGKVYPAGGSRQGSIKYASARLLQRKPNWLEKLRLRFVAAMQTTLPEPVASFGLGILIGQRSTLP